METIQRESKRTGRLRTICRADLYRYAGNTSFQYFLFRLFASLEPGFRFTYVFRHASASLPYTPLGIFYRLLKRRMTHKYGIQIPTGTRIGPGFYMSHFGRIIIGQKVVIGQNCNVAHNVTIGGDIRGKRRGYPTIGNNVWIGTGAVIIGSITIGDDVLVAPNTHVNFDVPAHSVVIGSPAKIIRREYATEGYIQNPVEEMAQGDDVVIAPKPEAHPAYPRSKMADKSLEWMWFKRLLSILVGMILLAGLTGAYFIWSEGSEIDTLVQLADARSLVGGLGTLFIAMTTVAVILAVALGKSFNRQRPENTPPRE